MAPDMQNRASASGAVCGDASLARDTPQDTIAGDHPQYQLIAKFRKNSREEFRIAFRKFTHFRGVELRVYGKNAHGHFVETPRGVAIRIAALPAIIKALQLAAFSAEVDDQP